MSGVYHREHKRKKPTVWADSLFGESVFVYFHKRQNLPKGEKHNERMERF